jgi:hypothetical protein
MSIVLRVILGVVNLKFQSHFFNLKFSEMSLLLFLYLIIEKIEKVCNI